MKEVKDIFKAMLPVALGVTAGLFVHEQIKKAIDKKA